MSGRSIHTLPRLLEKYPSLKHGIIPNEILNDRMIFWLNVITTGVVPESIIGYCYNCLLNVTPPKPESYINDFWGCVSRYQRLSEDFMREWCDNVVWRIIVQRQTLSEEFLIEMQLRGYI